MIGVLLLVVVVLLLATALLGEGDGAALVTTMTVGGIAEAAGNVFCRFVVIVAVPADKEDVSVVAGCVLVTLYATLTPVANNLRRTFTTDTLVILTTAVAGIIVCNAAVKDVRKEVESLVTPEIVCTTFTVLTTALAATGLKLGS